MASGKKRFTQAAGFEQIQKHVGLYKQAFAKEDGNGSRMLPCVWRKPDGKGGQHQPRTHVHGMSMASFKRFIEPGTSKSQSGSRRRVRVTGSDDCRRILLSVRRIDPDPAEYRASIIPDPDGYRPRTELAIRLPIRL